VKKEKNETMFVGRVPSARSFYFGRLSVNVSFWSNAKKKKTLNETKTILQSTKQWFIQTKPFLQQKKA